MTRVMNLVILVSLIGYFVSGVSRMHFREEIAAGIDLAIGVIALFYGGFLMYLREERQRERKSQ